MSGSSGENPLLAVRPEAYHGLPGHDGQGICSHEDSDEYKYQGKHQDKAGRESGLGLLLQARATLP